MKIAIVGGAPSSAGLAPYGDPTWQIWGCSPSSLPFIKRSDAWFEIHRWRPAERQSMDFVVFLGMHQGPVYMAAPQREVPSSVAYPKDEMIAMFGRRFFTSSISWMAALAIATLEKSGEEEKALGFYGVDLQAADEYQMQRGGCHFFITEAERRGIAVVAPPESDILAPPPLYGFCEQEPGYAKLMTKLEENRAKLAQQREAARIAEAKANYFAGAVDATEYIKRTQLW